MFFTIPNKQRTTVEQLRSDTLLKAYFVIQKYPLHASDIIMDNYLQQQYNMSLKNMCINLLLNMTFYSDKENNLILLFKDKTLDTIAQLITYGNGAIPGSKILQVAFK